MFSIKFRVFLKYPNNKSKTLVMMYVLVYLVNAMGMLGSHVIVHHYKVRRIFYKGWLLLAPYNYLQKLICNDESNPCSADPLNLSHLRI